MNKTVILTPDEVNMIYEDIDSTREYFDTQLSSIPEVGFEWDTEQIEDSINKVNIAESILKKLDK